MNQESHLKVTNAGFTILRCDDQPSPRIKFKGKNQLEWKTLEKFETKAARDRKYKELLKMHLFIND